MILDHTQDLTGRDTHRLTTLYTPPAFVKEASRDLLHGDPTTQPASTYGDPINRVYPCHSSAATWLSTAFFLDKQASLQPAVASRIDARLRAAASHFGITAAVDSLRAKMAADAHDDIQKLPDDVFALVWRGDNGTVERHYPLRNAVEVKTAADWFGRFRDEFAFDDRQQIASKIIEKAAEYAAPLDNSEMLYKTAGNGYCSPDDMFDALTVRAQLTRRSHPAEAAQLEKTAAAIKQNPPSALDTAFLHKLAGILDQYDRVTKLTALYDNGGLDRPEESLFMLTEKTAADFVKQHVQTTAGTVYEKSALAALPLDHVRDWLGQDFADAVAAGGLMLDVEKIAEIVPTLPLPEAAMFDQMVAAAGIRPFARDKAASDLRIPAEEMVAMALQYEEAATPGNPLNDTVSVLD